MAQPAERRWTMEEFFAWQERQPERYELVEGYPVRLMAGAKNVHDEVVVNLIAELRNQLRGRACRPFTGDSSVETVPGQVRRPDAGVDCGRRDPNGLKASEPRMVAEVLSPSTRDFDSIVKLAEYQAVESLDSILYIEPNLAEVVVWRRADDRTWVQDYADGLDAEVALPSIGVTLRLADLYDGVELTVGPRRIGSWSERR